MTSQAVDTNRLIKRISEIRASITPGSKVSRGALETIGMVLSGDMKVRAQRQRIYDTGSLINNTTYRLTSDGLEVGTFGVKYAKFHEYGTKPSHKMWLYLMATMDERRGARGSSKGVIQTKGQGGSRVAWIKARPYVGPTLKDPKNQKFIIDTLRGAYQE